MDYCLACGYPLSPSEQRCSYCGTDASRQCPNCRSPVPRSAGGACPRCGARLDAPAQVAPPATQSPQPAMQPPTLFSAMPPGTQVAGAPPHAATSGDPVSGYGGYGAVGPGMQPAAPVGAGVPPQTTQPVAPSPPAPKMSDPVETLALELGISHLKARRLVESGIAVEHLRRMSESDIARVLNDPETARIIKLRVGHEFTEREARGELDALKRQMEPVMRLARDLGAPLREFESGIERAAEAIAGSRPAEAMEMIRRLKEGAAARRVETLRRARGEIASRVAVIETAGIDAFKVRDAVARIDVAIASDDANEGLKAATDGLVMAKDIVGRVESVRQGAARGEEIVALLESLGRDVMEMRGELRICDGLMKGGKWDEAARIVDRVQAESVRQVAEVLASAIVKEKRRALDQKLRGSDVRDQVAALRQSQSALRKGSIDEAVGQFRKYQEIAGARP